MLAAAVIAAAVAWYLNLPAATEPSLAIAPARVAATESVSALPAPAVPEHDRRPSRPAEADPATEHARIDALFAEFDRRFVAEPLDLAASSQARAELERALEDPLLNRFGTPIGQRIDCRGRLCRVELRFADRAHADDWTMFYPVQAAATLSRVRTRMDVAADESASLVIYGTRAGAEALLSDGPAFTAAAYGPGR